MLVLASSSGCSNKEKAAAVEPPSAEQAAMEEAAAAQPAQLPVRYRKPGYVIASDEADNALSQEEEKYALKVGANITSTKGPQPLWDIIKRLGNLKGMSVSWANDVDREVKVDVNIRADDNFFEALDNLLRQVGYFHEIQNNTIVIRYKITRQYHVSIPYMKGEYTTNVGGDFIPTGEEVNTGTSTEGTAKITSTGNEFDVWKNITDNLTLLMAQEKTEKIDASPAANAKTGLDGQTDQKKGAPKEGAVQLSTLRKSKETPYFFIDKALGIVTVTAPLRLQKIIDSYFKNLNNELYRQVIIEAKIIEVYLKDNSKIGIDWSSVLKNFDISGLVDFGYFGQVYPQVKYSQGDSIPQGNEIGDHVPFVSKITLNSAPFSVMLNALNEQGDATVLSNPKVTAMNGQPAVLSVFKNIAYIKKVEVTQGTQESPGDTYSVTPGTVSEGVAFGVLPSIVDEDSVILHLTPITTDLVNDQIEERTFPDGSVIGLPQVNVREMSTMVKVHNGEMVIIGGLIDKVEGKTGDFAPVLGSIPLVKYLFGVEEKRMEKRELVILLTPRVI